MNIIARKPKNSDSEYIVVDRGGDSFVKLLDRYVSATASPESLENNSWFWGHYFPTLKEAMAHFNGR